MVYIIGSGPSSVAAIAACVELKIEVTILDIGFTAKSKVSDDTANYGKSKIPLKTIYGSTFPYWKSKSNTYQLKNKSEAMSSHAKGGFSNTWGAGIFPYAKEEFSNWPIEYDAICKYYKKLDTFLPLAASPDILQDRFPLFHSNATRLKPSSQFQKIFKKVGINKSKLLKNGVYLGKSRMAIEQKNVECSYCGKCIEGCPDHIIYCTSHTLDHFLSLDTVHYEGGIQVDKIKRIDGQTAIYGYDLNAKKDVIYHAEKVYVGCGALSTTQIMMRSLDIYDKPVLMKDSQYFIFPILGPPSSAILEEKVFTLSGGFLEINNTALDKNRIHISLYGYSPFLKNYIYSTLGIFGTVFKPFVDFFLKRMYIGQGFIHSEGSNLLELILTKSDQIDTIEVKNRNVTNVKTVINKTVRFFNKHLSSIGLRGFGAFLKVAPTGKSFHTGGSMPMRQKPKGDLETSVLGEVNSLPGVHIIDATIFPEIESGPITYTMMANAYRIVTESSK